MFSSNIVITKSKGGQILKFCDLHGFVYLLFSNLVFFFQEADIGVGPINVVANRLEVVDFLFPVHREESALVYRYDDGDCQYTRGVDSALL